MSSKEARLGKYIEVTPGGEEADFWITRDGEVTEKPVKKAYAIKVTDKAVFVPKYLYYAMMNLFHNQKYHLRFGKDGKVTKDLILKIQLERK